MKIVVWSILEEGAVLAQRLSLSHDVIIVDDKAKLRQALVGAQGVMLENSRYDADIVKWLTENSVRWVQLLSAGYENVIRFGHPPSTIVCNASGMRSASVAEHAMALLLGVAHALPATVEKMREQNWHPPVSNQLRSLEGLTALIIGYGSIGQEITRRLTGFGVRITTANRSKRMSDLAGNIVAEAFALDELDRALSQADLVIVAIAHTPETRHLIGESQFALMKPDAILINIARGAVIDTQAMIKALNENRLHGAGLDVTDPEPLPKNHPLWHAKNVLISPHISGTGTPASNERLYELVIRNADYLTMSLPLRNVITLS